MRRKGLLALAAMLALGAGFAAREIYKIKRRTFELAEDEPCGLQKGNAFIWIPVKALFLPIFGYANWWRTNLPLLRLVFQRRLKLIGIENIVEALRLNVAGVIFATDHRSSADVFMPQIILYLHGFKDLAERLFFYIVGMIFVNRDLISFGTRGRDIIPILPERMMDQKRPKVNEPGREAYRAQIRIATRINKKAREDAATELRRRRWLYVAPEGTRSREGPMAEAPKETVGVLSFEGAVILPVAQEGTEKMWPIGSWPRPLNEITLIVGKPVTNEQVWQEAAKLHAEFGVGLDRAFVDVVMRRIALLHIEHGNPWYAGFYAEPNEVRYAREKKG